jgi:hypothetical protein
MNLARLTFGILAAAALGLSAGCGSGSTEPQVDQNRSMEEIAGMVKRHMDERKRPPRSLADLAPYENEFIEGYTQLMRNGAVLEWGVPIEPAKGDTVLGYEKAVPEKGGHVVMQDGTVKQMTAAEFQAAPKAGKK